MLYGLVFVFLGSIVVRIGWAIGNLLLMKFNQFTGTGMQATWHIW